MWVHMYFVMYNIMCVLCMYVLYYYIMYLDNEYM